MKEIDRGEKPSVDKNTEEVKEAMIKKNEIKEDEKLEKQENKNI